MTTITINPSASNHDAWETGPGVVTLTGEVRIAAGTAWGGLLLPSVGVPAGATIISATLYYQADNSTHDSPGHTWYAQAADNAAVFTTTASSISSRSRTTASVADSATNISYTTYRAVTITSLIAEVTGRGGWASGNNIALIADGGAGDVWIRSYDDGTGIWYVEIVYTSGTSGAGAATLGAVTSTAAGALAAKGAAAATLGAVSGTAAATLAIEGTAGSAAGSFTLDIAAGGDDGVEVSSGEVGVAGETLGVHATYYPYVGLLFRGVAIPAGAVVTAAHVNLYVTNTVSDSPALTIRGQFNPANFATTNYNLSSRTKTAAGVSWVASNIGTGIKASPDISAVLNEIVGTAGWASGDDLALFLIDNGTGGNVQFAPYENDTYPPPQLVVEWTLYPSTDVAIPLATLTGAAAAVSLAVAPGAVAQLLDTLAVALALETTAVTPGGVAQLLDTLSAAASPVALSVAPGAVSQLLDTLSATAAAVTLAPIPGGVAIVLDTHGATLQVVALSIQGDASYIALNTVTGALSVIPLAVLPGEAVASLNTLIGLLQVMDVSVGQGIVLSTLNAALSAVGAAVVPGTATVDLATLAHALQAVGLSVAPGATSVDLDTLSALLTLIAAIDTPDAVDVTIVLSSLMAALSVTDLGAIPGDMLIGLQTLAGQLSLTDLLVFVMLGYAMHGTRAIGGARAVDYAPLIIKTGDTEGRDR